VADTSLAIPAIRYFGQTVAIDPGFTEAWFIMGALMHNRHDYPGAIRAFVSAGNSATDKTPPQYSRAMARVNAGKSWYRLGLQSFRASDYDSSLVCFRNSAGLDPSNPNTWLNLASSHYRLGRPDSAEVYYRLVTRMDPRETTAWDGLGVSVWALHRFDEAAGYFRKAVEIDPSLKDKYRRLGIAL
jgi:tetratricopeptide (TPR) repeat protein